MADSVKINDVGLFGGTLAGSEKIPMDNGSGNAYTLNVNQISNYTKSGISIPTKVSELDNDLEFVESEKLATINSVKLNDGANFELATTEALEEVNSRIPTSTKVIKVTTADGTVKQYTFYIL